MATPRTPCPPHPCPPAPPPPCPQVCPPPPPPLACRVKPIMRGLHWAQTKRNLVLALLASATGGLSWYLWYVKPRMERYREFYALTELEEWADEMAKKGLFQSVPKEGFEKKKE